MVPFTRGTYLTGDVAGFRDWLAERLQGRPIDFPQPSNPTYSRLRDAFCHYSWPDKRKAGLPKAGHPYRLPVVPALCAGSSFLVNDQILQRLQTVLRRAYHHQPGNPTRLVGAVAAILYWGGVYTETRPGRGNKGWLTSTRTSLRATLNRVVVAVNSGTDTYNAHGPLHFTAGTTKVYSLLLNDFIIYDSRVASALAWLVKSWWTKAKCLPLTNLPPQLRFVCLPRRGRAYGAGNPALNVFPNRPAAARGHLLHYTWNVRANWLLHDALSKARSAGSGCPFSSLREVEAALFQMGR